MIRFLRCIVVIILSIAASTQAKAQINIAENIYSDYIDSISKSDSIIVLRMPPGVFFETRVTREFFCGQCYVDLSKEIASLSTE